MWPLSSLPLHFCLFGSNPIALMCVFNRTSTFIAFLLLSQLSEDLDHLAALGVTLVFVWGNPQEYSKPVPSTKLHDPSCPPWLDLVLEFCLALSLMPQLCPHTYPWVYITMNHFWPLLCPTSLRQPSLWDLPQGPDATSGLH